MECITLVSKRGQKELEKLNDNKIDLGIKTIEIINPMKIKVELVSDHILTITFPEKYPYEQPIVKINYYNKTIECENYSPAIRLGDIVLNVNKLLALDDVQEKIKQNIVVFNNNNEVIQLLKNKNKDLKIVIGVGNVDALNAIYDGLDYSNFRENYDAGITNYKDMIDVEKKDFLALDLSIDDNYFTESVTSQLKNSCSVVIFDFSVSKFFRYNKGIHLLIDTLIPETGCLYIENQFTGMNLVNCNKDTSEKVQREFDRNFGKAFMVKDKLQSTNTYAQIIKDLYERVDENNKLYFKNMFKDSEYEINFEIIIGVYPLHKGIDNGFPNTKYYKITKVCK